MLKSSKIEGVLIHPEQVHSLVARKLGLDIVGLVPSDRNVAGVVEMLLDATQNYAQMLTAQWLFGWHSALFPNEYGTKYKIIVGHWRDDLTGSMQVVSGAICIEEVHFEAPSASKIDAEMVFFWIGLIN